MLPNFIVIGAPRSGTTWLHTNLRDHPDVFMPKNKELHFFDTHYEKGIEYYKQQFAGARHEKAVGEATPSYLHSKEALKRIKTHLPEAKLIVSLRNPIDRLYSRYWNAKAKYKENKHLSFEEKIKSKPSMIEEGLYYDHLKAYYKQFRREQVLILLFEEIQKTPQQALDSIYNFLEIESQIYPSLTNTRINSASSKKSLAKSKTLWYIQRALTKAKIHQAVTFIENINKTEIPPMNPETKKYLIENFYKEQNNMLSQLINKDLSHWNKAY